MLLLLLSEKILDPQQAGIMFFLHSTFPFFEDSLTGHYDAEAEDRGLRTVQFAQTSQRKSKASLEGPNLHWL